MPRGSTPKGGYSTCNFLSVEVLRGIPGAWSRQRGHGVEPRTQQPTKAKAVVTTPFIVFSTRTRSCRRRDSTISSGTMYVCMYVPRSFYQGPSLSGSSSHFCRLLLLLSFLTKHGCCCAALESDHVPCPVMHHDCMLCTYCNMPVLHFIPRYCLGRRGCT